MGGASDCSVLGGWAAAHAGPDCHHSTLGHRSADATTDRYVASVPDPTVHAGSGQRYTLAVGDGHGHPGPASGSLPAVPVTPFNRLHVHAMNPDGTGIRRITRGSANDNAPAWSADGMRLVFQNETSPRWSPDGQRIAFAFGEADPMAGRVSHQRVVMVNVDGSGWVFFDHQNAWDDGFPAWSADGGSIAFTVNWRSAPTIAVMHVQAQTTFVRLTSGTRPDWR